MEYGECMLKIYINMKIVNFLILRFDCIMNDMRLSINLLLNNEHFTTYYTFYILFSLGCVK